jgi:hypothetical protein
MSTRELTANGETSNQEIVLITREVDVLLHPRDVGIAQNSTVYRLSVKGAIQGAILGDLEDAPR